MGYRRQPFTTLAHPHTFLTPPPPHTTGELTVLLFVLFLEGKANLNGTGTITPPSAEATKHVTPADKDRLRKMKSVKVEDMQNLKGRRGGFGLSVSCVCVCVLACAYGW